MTNLAHAVLLLLALFCTPILVLVCFGWGIPRAKKLLRTPEIKTAEVRADGRLVRLTGHLLARSPMRSPIDGKACFCSRIALIQKERHGEGRGSTVVEVEADVAPMMFHADSCLEDETGLVRLRFQDLRLKVGRERWHVLEEATCPPSLREAFEGGFDDLRRGGHEPKLRVREQLLAPDERVTLYGFGVPDPDAPEDDPSSRPLLVAISAEPPLTRLRLGAPFALIGLTVISIGAAGALLMIF